jgi:hypothetical protein
MSSSKSLSCKQLTSEILKSGYEIASYTTYRNTKLLKSETEILKYIVGL